MKRRLALLFLLLGLAGAWSVVPGHAHAASVTAPEVVTPVEPPVGDTLAGVYAAVGCGLFSRALMGGMVFPGTVAGAIATCGYMFFDTFFIEN